MAGILIFTNQEILNHKIKDGMLSDGNECYWTLTRMPVRHIDRLYFAIKGQVKGYFKIKTMPYGEIVFNSETWTPIEEGEVLKPSQGWRYYDE